MEIRGAGNVLGPEQSGHMMSVGYGLYLKLLEEAVMEEKGETPPQRVECAADLTLSANLPATYVSDPGQRVDLYRRIALIRSEDARSDILDELIDRYGEPPKEAIALLDIALLRAEARRIALIRSEDARSDILDELIDRYGEPPKEAIALLDIALLRAEASAAGVTEIKQQDGRLLLTFQNADFQRLSILCGDTDYKGRLLLNAGSQPYVSLRLKSGETPLSMARTLVADFQRLSILCGDTDYKGRLLLNAGSQPYVSLRLKSGETPLSMARTLVEKYAATAS